MLATTRTTLILVVLTLVVSSAQTPNPPTTGPNSVQIIAGGTDLAWISVYPPTTYADGSPIPTGRAVTINVYRSFDGGATYSSRVRIEGGGSGFTGQGAAGSRTKPWIDTKISVGVDNKAPYLVYLAASATVGGAESLANVSWLTFRYYPSLLAYETPAAAGGDMGPVFRGLAGTWNLPEGATLVINQNGRQFTGSLNATGFTARIAGSVSGRTYTFRWNMEVAGENIEGTTAMTVSTDGTTITCVSTFMGESETETYLIRGRNLIRA